MRQHWDAENRLVASTVDGATTTHTYAASGLRRRRQSAAEDRHFVWDGQNLLAELDEGLATTARQTDFPGWWGGLSSRWTAAGSEHYTHDLSANTRQVLDGSGAATATAVYTAFGTALAAADGPVGFGGQVGYYQDETERLYVRARHYRPGVGRWMSRDPLGGSIPGLRMYSLVGQNPLRYTDASKLTRPNPDHRQEARSGRPKVLWEKYHGDRNALRCRSL